MKKRVLAILLVLATLSSTATLFAGAVPYAPPAPAMKEFGQQHLYFYETEGAIPREDGLVTDSDGYGEPVATYNMRYITTADKVVMQDDGLTPRDEYKLVDAGDRSGQYNVFPTPDSPDEVWNSIAGIETDSPYAFPYAKWYLPTTYSATASYYFYNPETQTFTSARFVTADNFDNYYAISSTTQKYHLQDWAPLTEKPKDWETNFRDYFTNNDRGYTKVAESLVPTTAVYDMAPPFDTTYYEDSDYSGFSFYNSSGSLVTSEPTGWSSPAWRNAYIKRTEAPKWEENTYWSYNYTTKDVWTLTETQPSDWETNFASYFKHTSTEGSYPTGTKNAYDVNDGSSSFYLVEYPRIAEDLGMKEAPAYETNTYYYNSGGLRTSKLPPSSAGIKDYWNDVGWRNYYERRAPQWQENTYYQRSWTPESGYVYTLLTAKPGNWDTYFKSGSSTYSLANIQYRTIYFTKDGEGYAPVTGLVKLTDLYDKAPEYKQYTYYSKNTTDYPLRTSDSGWYDTTWQNYYVKAGDWSPFRFYEFKDGEYRLTGFKPADWETNHQNYFIRVGGTFEGTVKGAQSLWEEGLIYSRRGNAQTGYSFTCLLPNPNDPSKPLSNWDSNTTYYKLTGATFVPYTFSPPEWEPGRYYLRSGNEASGFTYTLTTAKPADWETSQNYYYYSAGPYSMLSKRTALSAKTEFEPGKYYSSSTAANPLMEKPEVWDFHYTQYYKDREKAPEWKAGYYYLRSGDPNAGGYAYTLTLTKPADWDWNYTAYCSKSEIQWYPVTGDVAPEFEAGRYYSGTPFQDLTYVVQDVKMLTQQPQDWNTNWKNYYYKPTSTGTTYYNLSNKTAPVFEPGIYYSGKKLQSKLFLSGEGSASGVPAITVLRNNHVVLPEEVKLYARYDDRYLYVAIEMKEADHRRVRYDNNVRFGSTINSSMGISVNNYSFGCFYRQGLDGSAPTVLKDSTGSRTSFHTNVNLSTAGYQMGVLNKYGNPNVTSLDQALTPGSWFNVKHYTKAQMDSILGLNQPAATEETAEGQAAESDTWMEEDSETDASDSSEEDRDAYKRSDTYGTTVYEYKQLWSVINDKYDGTGSAVPEVFSAWHEINLENNLATGAFMLAIEVPRDTRHLIGCGSSYAMRTNKLGDVAVTNYPAETYSMRFTSHTGLTKGEGFGKVRFQWANLSSTYGILSQDYILTDYDNVSQKKSLSAAHVPAFWYPSGRQQDSKYAVPYLDGAQIRTDGADVQGLRFMVNIPKTNEEISEAGILIAPTEASANKQLFRNMGDLRYNNVQFATYYGFDLNTRRFVNLTEDVFTNFASNATPADSESFVTNDNVGGLPAAIYHVEDKKLDLENPYNEGNKADTYAVEYTGLQDQDGTYNDWFTFYTIRPYVIYEDGTVVYGEHAYRSVYYVMCWTIQNLVTSYNTAQSLTTANNRYNMDQMALTAMTYSDGTTVKQGEETVYTDAESTPSSQSPYFGSINFSLYENTGEARMDVFRAYAVSLFNRANKGSSLRAKEYDSFTDEQKEVIDQYVAYFENIWQCILKCESKLYYYEK